MIHFDFSCSCFAILKQTLESPNVITHNIFSFPNSFTNGSIKTRRFSTDDGDEEEICDQVTNAKTEEKKVGLNVTFKCIMY